MDTRSRTVPMIRDVWADNVVAEFKSISELIDSHPFVSMDTEFPGIVKGEESRRGSYEFQLKPNVDELKLIQIGLTLTDCDGNLAEVDGCKCIWQINFCDFNEEHDEHNRDSIELLKNHGIDFEKNLKDGVSLIFFSELIMDSGLVLNPDITWITFHGCFDFGYLLKALTGDCLPKGIQEFLEEIELFFGSGFFDVKYLIHFCKHLQGGLDQVAGMLGINREVGNSHQAGSDCLLTSRVFFRIIRNSSYSDQQLEKHAGVLYRLVA